MFLKGQNMKKIYFCLMVVVFVVLSLMGCSKKEQQKYTNPAFNPLDYEPTGEYNLDFVSLHNFVIDSMMEEDTPFFFIKNGTVDISGTNDPRVITLTCECLKKTTVEDLDLFLSMAIRLIGQGAHIQDSRFEMPVEAENTYQDFGTVFNYYDLKLNCVLEDDQDGKKGAVLRDNYIPAGKQIPVNPRYWSVD